MPGGTANRTSSSPSAQGNGHGFRALVTVLMVGTIAVTIGLSYLFARQSVTQASLERREGVAALTATLLEERFVRLVDVGMSLATRVTFRGHVAAGRWDQAIAIMESVPEQFPYIERLFLADVSGRLMADVPHATEVVGQDFSYRDWYKGVSAGWRPYLSEVYRRAAAPQVNVVAVAIPIRGEGPSVEPVGILVLQVRSDVLLEWLREIPVGKEGSVFVVDHRGHLAAHTELPPQTEIRDVSREDITAAIRAGQSGISSHDDPETRVRHVAAYAPVPRFGWGVVVEQEIGAFLAEERAQLGGFSALVAGLLAILLLVSFLAVRTSRRLSLQRAETRRLHETRDADLERQVALRTRQLQESQRKFSALVDHVPGMVYRCKNDRRWSMEYASKGTEELTGYAPEVFTRGGTAFADVILPEDRERVWDAVQEAVVARRPYVLDYRIRARDGAVKEVWEQGGAVFGPDGTVQALEGIIMDVTEEREEAREQERLNKLLVGRELRMVELKKALAEAKKPPKK